MSASLKRGVHKTLIFLHKWLGVTLALLFVMWFASGMVLYFVPFPNLTPVERFAALPPLQLPPGCCLTAQQAADRAGLAFSEARLGMADEVPVWRLLSTVRNTLSNTLPKSVQKEASKAESKAERLWRTVDAHSGQLRPPLSLAAAGAVAEAFSGRKALHTELLERDQWTVPQGLNAYRPLLRVELDGPEGLELYVSPAAAEVVRDTRRAERFWNWLGAVPHWIYFTELRRYPEAWHNVVVWLALPGVVLALTGLVLGLWHLFLNRVRWIPYRQFWLRWHHISGLVAAIFTLTWIFSGLLSMNPFGVFASRGALNEERTQWAGAKAIVTLNPAQTLAVAQASNPRLEAKEIDVLQVAGQAWYRVRGFTGDSGSQALVRADMSPGIAPPVLAALPDATLQASLQNLRSDAAQAGAHVGTATLTRLTAYDDQYYAREINGSTPYTRPLPVWRAQWADGVTLYADPASARLLLRVDASNRWQRVLYNGLHSFDFAPLLARPWLRDALVVVLSLLGTGLCITSCVIAWRVLVPRKRHGHAQKRAQMNT